MAELIADNLVRVAWLAEDQQDLIGPRAAVVRWTVPGDPPRQPLPSLPGRLVQVYVNGELAAVSDDPAQAELVVPLIPNIDWPAVNVQAVAVAPSESTRDFSHLLGPQSRGGRVLLRWPRTNNASPGSTINIFGNGGQGAINFAAPLNDQPVEWFPDGHGHWGFGLSGFGQSDFGYDGQFSVGLGLGGFGIGGFGFDAEWASWLSPPLATGTALVPLTHRFAVVGYDPLGNAGAASPVAQAMVLAPPPRISDLAISGAAVGDALVVTWGPN